MTRRPYHACTHALAPVFSDRRRRRIGILGGSFNPAHAGHSHIADLAVQHLQLDEVWWLVSPQNPLKSTRGMGRFSARFDKAVAQASSCRYSSRMRVSRLEQALNISQTALSLRQINRRAPRVTFTWIMGADNLAGFHRWHRPHVIARTMAIAVVNRPDSRARALASQGARIAGQRLRPRQLAARGLPPLNWCFIDGRLNHQSATALRAKRQG
ncbi:MAG: nicotinate-nicotinamide nucleotide adenylyltransferase [Alphaproteobacteria bacterium]|nr:nicotinate-nicotinamide nucleotide adenylyltransferase [Alphaproteobacteria bacterium]